MWKNANKNRLSKKASTPNVFVKNIYNTADIIKYNIPMYYYFLNSGLKKNATLKTLKP